MLRRISFTSLALSLALSSTLVACKNGGGMGGNVTPQNEEQKTLYALGLYLAKQTAPFNLKDAELGYVISGFRDGVDGKKSDIDLKAYGPKLGEMAKARQTAKGAEERKAGEAVLASAAGEAGAEKLDGGLIYKSITEGTGDSPEATDRVKVNYKGTLRDGKVFDSSYDRGQPATFGLGQVVKCWTVGVQKMKVGGKAKLTCPADLAYGDRPQANIPPGSVLMFEVELLSIEPPAAMPQGMGMQMPGMQGGHPMQIGGGMPGRPMTPGGMPGRPMTPGAVPPPGGAKMTPPGAKTTTTTTTTTTAPTK